MGALRSDRTGIEFAGYASLFDVADAGGDVVAPGAFGESLARRGAAGVRMLFQHDPAEPLGRWLDIREDARGLRVTGLLSAGSARARELADLIRDGALDGLSIGFRTVRAAGAVGAVRRRLLAVDLWEISIVTFPMLAGARVSAIGFAAAPAARPRDPGAASSLAARHMRLAAARLQPTN